MKRVILCVLLIAFAVAACGSKEPQMTAADELGIDVSGGTEIFNFDTGGGLNGDGTVCEALKFSDERVLEQIEGNPQWKAFPLDATVTALVYGISDEASSIGPYLCDGGGTPLVPDIQNGYYLLIDRQDETGDILERASFNFTLGIYDSDSDTLYLLKLDT